MNLYIATLNCKSMKRAEKRDAIKEQMQKATSDVTTQNTHLKTQNDLLHADVIAMMIETVIAPFKEDAFAAYTQALLWYIERDERRAEKAMSVVRFFRPPPHRARSDCNFVLGGRRRPQRGQNKPLFTLPK